MCSDQHLINPTKNMYLDGQWPGMKPAQESCANHSITSVMHKSRQTNMLRLPLWWELTQHACTTHTHRLCLHYEVGMWFSSLDTHTHANTHWATTSINSSVAVVACLGAMETRLSHTKYMTTSFRWVCTGRYSAMPLLPLPSPPGLCWYLYSC